MTKRVAILGGGIGGLSAAHELVKHGFSIDVYERSGEVGGKAKSQLVADPRCPGRTLPGEHGFRFYPHFYKHLFQTMKEIPFPRDVAEASGRAPSSDGSVYGNLTETAEAGIADGRVLVGPRVLEDSARHLLARMRELYRGLDVSARDVGTYTWFLLKFLTSSTERREGEYEHQTWSQFVGRDRYYSSSFARLLAAVPRTMVAMCADVGSARTIGNISCQLMFTFGEGRGRMDATMTGPTTEVWLEPWRAFLASRGVRFHFGSELARFELEGARVARAWIVADGRERAVTADYYVSALPLEAMQRHIDAAMEREDESLRRLKAMERATAWMSGAQFFLKRDVRLCKGHLFYPGAAWGLTSISQAQFWEPRSGPVGDRWGAGDLRGILSVDVGDWDAKSDRIGKSASECGSRAEILDEVWAQIKAGLGGGLLRDDDVLHRHLDENVVFQRDASGRMRPHNTTPLLIHRPGSHLQRPDAELRIPNLLLASDYVRTFTDLASMEAANEAGRRAVRGVLRREGRDPELCPIWPLVESASLEPARRLDRLLFLNGKQRHVMDVPYTIPWSSIASATLMKPPMLAPRT